MSTRILIAAAAGAATLFALPLDASAGGKKPRPDDRDNRIVERDCKTFNGPNGYDGNPWCDGGWKYAEDWAPGTGGYLDVFDLPQVQRLRRRIE